MRPLTERELTVLRLIAEGYTNGEIAKKLGLAYDTIKEHVTMINHKLETHNRAHAVTIGFREGLLK